MQGRPAAVLFVASIALALLADLLLANRSWGIDLGLWAAVVAFALWRLSGSKGLDGRIGALAVLFSFLFALRDSDALKLANGLAIAFCLGGFVVSLSDRKLKDASIFLLAPSPLRAIGSFVTGFIDLWVGTRQERRTSTDAGKRSGAILRGVLLATPLLIVFGALFASADAIFRSNVERLAQFDLDFGSLNAYVWCSLLSFVLVGGLLYRTTLQPGFPKPPVARVSRDARMGITEIGIALGSLVLLFGSFIGVQFRFLFASNEAVKATVGLSYADYARGGFFELVCVAALALVVLVGADALLRRERPADETVYRWLGRGLVVMVFCVVASALMRMRAYVDAFGLTELRIYSTAFMLWLALAFVWLLFSTLQGRPQRLAFGLLLAGLTVIAGTNLVNPDALIVRTNLSKPKADFAYLKGLSDDAVVALRDRLEAVPAPHRDEARMLIRKREEAAGRGDWRELNLSRWALRR